MADANININLEGNVFVAIKQLKKQFISLNDKVEKIETTSKNSFKSIGRSIKNISFVNLTQGIDNLNQSFEAINGPGLAYGQSLSELSALTGVTGKDLDELGAKAKASASEFGGSATASINTFKVLLGRLGPGIAENKEALSEMERNVQILSKTMGGDSAGAVDALTTAMLQFGVDLSDPEKATERMAQMMDVMANSAQEGAAEVPQISAALKVAGVQLKQSNVSFVEANAAIQALAKGGKEGSEAGVTLRNVLGKLAGEDVIPKEAADKLRTLGVNMDIVSNTALPFTDRLRELKKAEGDATIMAQIFGVENASGAKILLDSVDAQDKLTTVINKSGGAMAQAQTVMESTTEKVARMKAKMDNFRISIFNLTGGFTAYLAPLGEVARNLSAFGPLVSGAGDLLNKLRESTIAQTIVTKTVTIAQKLWNLAMMANPIGLIIGGVALLATGIYALSSALSSGTTEQKMANQVHEKAIDIAADEIANINMMATAIKESAKGTDERTKAVDKLIKKYPGLLEKYKTEANIVAHISEIQKDLADTAMLRAEKEAVAEIYKAKIKEKVKEKLEGAGTWDTIQAMVSRTTANATGGLIGDYNSTAEKQNEADVKAYDDEAQAAYKLMKEKEAALNKKLSKPAKSSKTDKEDKPDTKTDNSSTTGDSLIPNSGNANASGNTKINNGNSSGGNVSKRNIRVTIDKLVENVNIHSTTLKESAHEIKRQVTEALTSSVRDFETAI